MLLAGHGRVYRTVRRVCRVQGRYTPVNSLKAAGLSWSIEASMSMGVRHFWQYSPCRVLSLAMLLSVCVPHALHVLSVAVSRVNMHPADHLQVHAQAPVAWPC